MARPDCMSAYSLRDDAQLVRFRHSKQGPQLVTYDPAHDSDPRRQDAAKIVVPAGQVSLKSTVRLPIGTSDGTTTLVTWDAWFGSEFRYEYTGIANYKTFQFASPAKRIWFEVRTNFSDAGETTRALRKADRHEREGRGKDAGRQTGLPGRNTPGESHAAAHPLPVRTVTRGGEIGTVDARASGAVGPNVTDGKPLRPKAGAFTVHAETWTRYWVLIEQRADDWDLVSLWVADEHTGPVQIFARRQLSVSAKAKEGVESFWLEYNSSANARPGLPERVGYVRNVVMLRNVPDVPSLLRRPEK